MRHHRKVCLALPALAALMACSSTPGPDLSDSANRRAIRPADDVARAAAARAANPNRPIAWWADVSAKPDSFYRSAEGRGMAENILSWQQEIGGWPLMNTTREPFTGDASRAGPWGVRAALIKASVNEMRFLARGFRATQDERYSTAVLRGLEFILSAQYPSGGWPHSFPVRDGYSRYATYNDDMMPDLMMLLREAATSADFAFLSAKDRKRSQAAFDRGVDFVLKSQIRVDGKLTAWGQQHDPITYEPMPARPFEPAAISGGESASVLHMLMSIPNPSADVKAAIEAAVQWYRDAQIDGLRLIQTIGPNADRIVVSDPNAPPIWARFYEIRTGRPIFAGRDGVIKYALAEIEQERRGGYAWYSNSGPGVFARYERWKNEQR